MTVSQLKGSERCHGKFLGRALSLLFLLVLPTVLKAQGESSSINGTVKDKNGVAIEMVQIGIKGTNELAFTDKKGNYFIENIKPGSYTLVFMFLGYTTQEKNIILKPGDSAALNTLMEQQSKALNEVEVLGKTQAQEVQEQPFSVTVIDTRPLKIKNADVNKVLNTTTGVRIREEGGMGSDFSFSLNGFSGNQVKFFIDGIPMDNFGSSLSLNNIPINLVDRIEVYKGVVPVFLGSDALGGAVNVVTSQKVQNFLDVSYSLGSFNQHRAAVVGRYMHPKSGFTINASSFLNYADNNYLIDVKIPDPVTGKVGEYEKIRRFHDGYRSQAMQLETGFLNKKFADKIMVGVIFSGNYKEIQNGLNMTQVAGQVFTRDKVMIPVFKYQKSDIILKGLSLNSYSIYNDNQSLVADSSSRKYDWRGNYKIKQIDMSGELSWDKTLFRFNDRSALNTSNLTYRVNEEHSFSLCNTYSWYRRVGEDPLAYNPIPFSKPNTLEKNVTGVAYGMDLFQKRWSTTFFTKLFNMAANVQEYDWTENGLKQTQTKYSYPGYGMATAYFLQRWIQVKFSFESTYRLPETYEMFGNGLLLQSNSKLEPEQSKNVNAGFLLKKDLGERHQLFAECSYLYRAPKNLIRLASSVITGQYENIAKTSVSSWEGALKYIYHKKWSLEVNGTYQNLLNTNRYEANGMESLLYLDRLPNIPFLFGNLNMGYVQDDLFRTKSKLMIDWSSAFVEAFYLKWPSQGNKANKYDIPRQLSHQVSVSCASGDGRYTVSLACTNLFNAKVYDNFMMQKPGRAFSVKLSYFISTSVKTNKNKNENSKNEN